MSYFIEYKSVPFYIFPLHFDTSDSFVLKFNAIIALSFLLIIYKLAVHFIINGTLHLRK